MVPHSFIFNVLQFPEIAITAGFYAKRTYVHDTHCISPPTRRSPACTGRCCWCIRRFGPCTHPVRHTSSAGAPSHLLEPEVADAAISNSIHIKAAVCCNSHIDIQQIKYVLTSIPKSAYTNREQTLNCLYLWVC